MADNWKSPTAIIGIATLILSMIGNVYQYYHLQNEKAKTEAEVSKSDAEKALLRQQVLELQDKTRRLDEIEEKKLKMVEDLNSQIKKVDENIEYMQKKINTMVYSEVKFGDEQEWIKKFYGEIDRYKEERLRLQTLIISINKAD
jgi:uncharacterized protein HemX